jgi:hypothetical protein
MGIHPVDGGLIMGAGSLWPKTYIMFSFIFLAKFSWLVPFFFKMAKNMCFFRFSSCQISTSFFFTNFLDLFFLMQK